MVFEIPVIVVIIAANTAQDVVINPQIVSLQSGLNQPDFVWYFSHESPSEKLTRSENSTVPWVHHDNLWTSSKTSHRFLSGSRPDSQHINIGWRRTWPLPRLILPRPPLHTGCLFCWNIPCTDYYSPGWRNYPQQSPLWWSPGTWNPRPRHIWQGF